MKGQRRRRGIGRRLYLNGFRPANPSANLRLQGIATALGIIARDHRQPALAAMVLDSLGLSLADLKRAGADACDLASLSAINSRLAGQWFELAAAELRPLGIALHHLPGGAFSVNFIDGAESTTHILHTLDLAVAVGRIMAADLTHDKHKTK
jgi:hypothetical protein